jgi:hypothetical protein
MTKNPGNIRSFEEIMAGEAVQPDKEIVDALEFLATRNMSFYISHKEMAGHMKQVARKALDKYKGEQDG